MEDHKGHNIVLATTARKENQTQVLERKRKLHRRIRNGERHIQELTDAVMSYKDSAVMSLEDIERISEDLSALLESPERRWSEVREQISAQQEAAVSRAEDVVERLQQEVAVLKTRDAEIEQLMHEEDPIHFLQRLLALQSSSVPKASPSITISPHPSFHVLMEYLTARKEDKSGQMEKTPVEVEKIHIVLPLEPKTRDELTEYSCQLTLDPNTAHRSLSLSEDNRRVWREKEQPCPDDHHDRFTGWAQVLCVQAVSACCYWEVEWTHELEGYGVDIAVSYRNIDRKGGGLECRLGCNDRSWRLECDPERCSFRHNNFRTEVLSALSSSRVGVYVDHKAGILSFYNVSDTMTLLHTEQTVFKEPLFPGFWLAHGASINICSL
ncbi:tripartite motif-containing protein 16-like [Engraulis encrasicolus]|uniref:tripartite motif-containing protein 16-like n=1 Tax=Engraulis encrasicolus TaxID=184585 RepID=UPI002FD47524